MRFIAYGLFKYLVLLGFFFGAGLAVAQSSAASIGVGSSVLSKNKLNRERTETNFSLGFELKTLQYAESSPVDNSSQQQAQFEFNFKKQGSVFGESQVIIGTFTEPKSLYYAVPQTYIGLGSENSKLSIGRKTEKLSFADSFFNLGLVQPHFTNDNINFMAEGLTGITGSWASDNMGLLMSFNPLFIPNQGPQISAENGQIISTNRWAQAPPAKFKFGDLYKNINYIIRDYNVSDIVAHSGYMLNAHFGENKIRPLLLLTYSKKPINELAFSRDTYGDISTFQGYVYLTPVVLNHEIQAADINFDYQNFKSTLSAILDQPENIQAKDLEVMQNLKPLSIYSLYVGLDFSSYLNKKFELYLASAIITGGEIKDLNRQQVESVFSVSNTRTLFKKPLKIGLKSEMFFIYNKALESDINFTYDQELKGALLNAMIKYAPAKNISLNLGADIIGVENELPSEAQGNFLDQYKANDRFQAGLSYVF